MRKCRCRGNVGADPGRVVKNTGDGFLAEFASAVDAVRCAVEIQRGMIDREPELPDERQIRFRVGINLGDVIASFHHEFATGSTGLRAGFGESPRSD